MNMKSEKKFKFVLQTGDWSLDGHNHVEKYTLSCNAKTIQDVRNAYYKAMRLIREDHHPHNIEFDFKTDTYQDFPKIDMQEALSSGLWIAKVTAWFINQGDPKLECKVVNLKRLPTLHFVGYDTKHRHIPSIGYTILDPNYEYKH